jgi:hypothetical protein
LSADENRREKRGDKRENKGVFCNAAVAAYFCNANNNGNANNNAATAVGGCAPDSVRYTMCRLLATDVSDTEGENVLL